MENPDNIENSQQQDTNLAKEASNNKSRKKSQSNNNNDTNSNSEKKYETARHKCELLKSKRGKSPILYLIVVGFHHKKGCQIEYIYPNHFASVVKENDETSTSSSADSLKLPKKWKYLPSLALPDGSHNYENDFVYFHLEDFDESDFIADADVDVKNGDFSSSNEKLASDELLSCGDLKLAPQATVYGVACYRQINADDMEHKDSDVTRNTLQKSVCILSSMPLYGSIRQRLHDITLRYFNQKDFRKTQILDNAFLSLSKSYELLKQAAAATTTTSSNLSLVATPSPRQQQSLQSFSSTNLEANYSLDLSLVELVSRYQEKVLVIFKLLLLQKKCLFQITPVGNLSRTIISFVSLFPDIFNCVGVDEESSPSSPTKKEYNENSDEENGSEVDGEEQDNGCLTMDDDCDNDDDDDDYDYDDKEDFLSTGYTYCSGFFDSNDLFESDLHRKGQLGPVPRRTRIRDEHAADGLKKKKRRKTRMGKKLEKNRILKNQRRQNNLQNQQILTTTIQKTQQQQQQQQQQHATPNLSSAKPLPTFSVAPDTPGKSHQSPRAPRTRIGKFASMLFATSPTIASSPLKTIESSPAATAASPQAPSVTVTTPTPASNSSVYFDIEDNNASASGAIERDQVDALIQSDFGMPLSLFGEFNMLHPYLSLYYLEYFSLVNKMSTKLFCTTYKLKNMSRYSKLLNRRQNHQNSEQQREEEKQSNDIGLDSLNNENSTTSESNSNHHPPIGYTIGATNILFRQRLNDKLDAFIDETDVTKNCDELSKQLELTNADQRFMYFIIKNLNKSKQQGANQLNSSFTEQQQQTNGAARKHAAVSNIKRTTSVSSSQQQNAQSPFSGVERERATQRGTAAASVTCVEDFDLDMTAAAAAGARQATPNSTAIGSLGSDDWIRTYFKWYLYTLLASIVKEEVYDSLKCDLEILHSSTSNSKSNSKSNSVNSSMTSLNASASGAATAASNGEAAANSSSSVIDINDFVLQSSTNFSGAEESSKRRTKSSKPASQNKKDSAQKGAAELTSQQSTTLTLTTNTASSTTSISSSNNNNAQAASPSDYKEDFNKQFVEEFKRTDCFKRWFAANKCKVAANVFSLESQLDKPISIDVLDPGSKSAAIRLLRSDLAKLESKSLLHPFGGNTGSMMHDLKIKMNFMLAGSDSGKKINKALTDGSKIIGGFLTNARSSLNTFLKTQQHQQQSPAKLAALDDSTASSNTKM